VEKRELCISAKCPKESDNDAFKQAARQDMPPGYTKEPIVYEPVGVKGTIVSPLTFIFVFLIGCLIIWLKFNELDFLHIIWQGWYVIVPAVLVIPLHELAHGGAGYLLTRPHRCPGFDHKLWMRFIPYCYTYLPTGAFLSKRRATIALLTPLLLAILPLLICIFVYAYVWVVSLFIFFWLSTGACSNDINQVIMMHTKEDGVLIAFRHGYNVIYPP
jgi:hypothetical protein